MTAASPQPAIPHPIEAHLDSCGIKFAFIIDDAYDPPTRESLREEIPVFWDQVLRDPDLLQEIKGISSEIEDQTDLDNDVLVQLYAQLERLPKLGPVCKRHLFAEKLEKLAQLEDLRQHLEQVKVKAIGVGSEQNLPEEPAKLIFIDYFLGPGDDATAVAVARARAAELYRTLSGDGEKPFIVLMSSKPDAAGAKDVFRDSSGLLNGLFGFVPKKDLRDRDKLYAHLLTWAIGMPTRHSIQKFAEALERAANEACKEFSRRVRALGVEDYANIQWLSLQPDGHPLGDYMLWLYKSLFAHLLHNHPGVLAEQKKLDALSFQEYTPSQFAPSLDLAEIYRCALTDPGVEALGPHPRSQEGSNEPYLLLGDMFFEHGKAGVVIVLNPACDLNYAPGMERRFPRDLFILLVRGELQPFEQTPREYSARTELFKHDGRVYRILWSFKRAVWKEYGKVWEWLQQQGYTHRERLALPYALEIQRAFAANLTRIGMPVKPPLRNADVEVYYEGEERDWTPLIPPVSGGARLISQRTGDGDKEVEQFALTLDTISAVVGGLGRAIEGLRTRQTKLSEAVTKLGESADKNGVREAAKMRGQLTGVQGKLDRLEKLSQMSERWLPIAKKPHALPPVGGIGHVDKELLWFFRDFEFSGKYNAGPPIVVHIRTQPKEALTMPHPETQTVSRATEGDTQNE